MTVPESKISPWQWLRPLLSIVVAVLAGVGFGLLTRLAFGTSGELSQVFQTMSVSFLALTPVALGVITVALAPSHLRQNWVYALLVPLVTSTAFLALVVAFNWEVFICLLMVVPCFLPLGSVGGVIACLGFVLWARRKNQGALMGLLAVVVLAPYWAAPLESTFPITNEYRTVESHIEIFASPEVVWNNITRVSTFTADEHRFSWFHLAGLPRPLGATLTADGVGGVRRGQWENGLAFVETVSQWEARRAYTIQMQADTSAVHNTALPLREIGGPAFDVVQGHYEIEALGPEHVIVHFTSVHRLSTRFNFYGGLWTDFFMRDVQNYILDVVKARSEAR